MPLDGSNTNPDLTNYSLNGLAWILRNGNDGHAWHFPESCQCAIRTAQARWGNHLTIYDMALGNSDAANRIFILGAGRDGIFDPAITPDVVAGRIDDFLTGRPIRSLVEGDTDPGETFALLDVIQSEADLVDA